MKKMISILLMLALICTGMIGCSKKKSTDTNSESANKSDTGVSTEDKSSTDNSEEPATTDDLKANEGTTITFAHGQGEWMNTLFDSLAKDFYDKTGITVKYTQVASDELDTWITAQYAAGEEPDMVYSAAFKGDDYFAQGKIIDLTSYYDSASPFSGNTWKDDFMDGMLESCKDSTGKSYIAGTISRAEVKFYYNKDLMQELGLGTEPPQTVSELFTMCDKILADGRYIPFSVMNSMSWNLGWLPCQFLNAIYSDTDVYDKLNIINQNNTLDYSEALLGLKTGVINYTDDRMVEYFKLMKNFTKYFNQDFNAASWEYESLFNDGKSVFTINGGWFPSQTIQNNITINYGVADIPYVDKGCSKYGYDEKPILAPSAGEPAIWISQKAADEGRADACVKFLQYLNDKSSGAQKFLDFTLLMPVVKDLKYPEQIAGLAAPTDQNITYTTLRRYDYVYSFNDTANSTFWTAYTKYLDPSTKESAEDFVKEVNDSLMPIAKEEIADRTDYNVESYVDQVKSN